MNESEPARIEIENYTADLDPVIVELVNKTRVLILDTVPDAVERYKWSHPWYELDGPFCYIMAFSKHVNLGIPRGAELMSRFEFLEGTGKGLRHIKIRTLDDLNANSLTEIILAAVALNQSA
jgi:hypothetical protein